MNFNDSKAIDICKRDNFQVSKELFKAFKARDLKAFTKQ